MPKPTPFVEHALEQMQGFERANGTVRARSMFGGWGIACDGLTFALVAGDVLYFKTDAESRPHFASLGLPFFTYEAKGKTATMNYSQAPDDVFDDEDAMTLWATLGLETARRAAAKSRQKEGATAHLSATKRKRRASTRV